MKQIPQNLRTVVNLLVALFALVTMAVSSRAANFTTAVQQGTAARWDAAIWNPGAVVPTAGNTYECIAGGNPTRIRNPNSGSTPSDPVIGVKTFPGDSLQLDANSEIRAKGVGNTINFPGVGGNAGLIMNGGNLDTGDNGVFFCTGVMLIQADSSFSCGDSGGNNTRGWKVGAQIRGSARLSISKWYPGGVAAVEVTNVNNPFSGTWFVSSGKLLGSALGSLGTANITINTLAATNLAQLELSYDINSPGTLILTNGGQMILHQNCTFPKVVINGTVLSARTYPYSELAASFPANFPAGGSGSITVQPPAPPPAPINVVAVSGDTQVRLSWSPVLTANSYWVLSSGTSGGPYAALANVTSAGYTNTGLANGTTIYYVIQSTNAIGASTNSSEVVGTPNPVVTGLTAVGGTNQASLAWGTPSGGASADSYNVKRSATKGGPYTIVASGVVDLTYTDTGLASGRTYFYVVEANLTGGGISNPSDEASAVTAPGTPNLTASLYAETAANLTWTLSDPVVDQFMIEQSTDDGANYTQIASVAGTARTYRNVGLAAFTTYTYRILARNSAGFSSYSDPASVTTPAFGLHINFAAGTGNSAGNPVAPVPAGYFQDIGLPYGDQGDGFNHGWDRNIVADGRYRQLANSPDLRYDTFVHLIKATPPAIWNIAVPNGQYDVHIVAGDPQNVDSVFQFDVEGVLTDTITPNSPAAFSNNWGDFRVGCTVTDGQLTIKSGPNSQTTANNNKICFIDITLPTPIVIATQPQSQTVEESRRVTLSVGLSSGSPPLTYQWFFEGIAIQDATNRTLFFPSIQQSQSGEYNVEITNPLGTVPSDTATVTVNPDITPPGIVSAYSLDGSRIKLIWDEVLDVASAGDVASYHVTAGGVDVAVNLATVLPDALGDSNTVILNVSGLTTSSFEVGSRLGNPVFDPFGNGQTGDPLISGSVFALGSGLTDDSNIGTATDPIEQGSTTVDPNHLQIVAGGSDMWNNADGFRYAYGSYTGDFDFKVRVTRLDPRDIHSKAGFMIRQDLTPGSPDLSAIITPHETALDGSGAGANDFEAGMRATAGGATTDWGGRPTNSPPWTNAWIRIQRLGNVFKAFWGTNGVNWSQFATNTGSTLPNTVYVGLGTTAHNNGIGQITTAVYEDFGIILPPTITLQPQGQTVHQNDPVTFTVEASGETPFSYQWRKNNVNIPSATGSSYTIASAQPSDEADYTVVVSNVDSSTSSFTATLAVRVKPSITAHPQSQTVVCGSVEFTVAAAGSPPLSYQWRKGGTDIPGANANTYTIASVTAGDAGNYSVRVENDVGFAISDDAVLTVSPDTTAPTINCPTGPITAQCSGPDGAVVNFTVTATDNCDPAPTIECSRPSGSTFGVGSTIVRCSARDSSGNSSLCIFEVRVDDPAPALLTIVRDGDNVTISWPQTCTSYSLEEKAVLDNSVPWSSSGAATLSGSTYQVTLSAGGDAKFFRLKGEIPRRP